MKRRKEKVGDIQNRISSWHMVQNWKNYGISDVSHDILTIQRTYIGRLNSPFYLLQRHGMGNTKYNGKPHTVPHLNTGKSKHNQTTAPQV